MLRSVSSRRSRARLIPNRLDERASAAFSPKGAAVVLAVITIVRLRVGRDRAPVVSLGRFSTPRSSLAERLALKLVETPARVSVSRAVGMPCPATPTVEHRKPSYGTVETSAPIDAGPAAPALPEPAPDPVDPDPPGPAAPPKDTDRGPTSHVREVVRSPVAMGAAAAVLAVLMLLAWHVSMKLGYLQWGTFAAYYTLLVSTYVLSRFVLAFFYRTPKDAGIEPTVAIIVPAFNEGEAVARTIDACLAVDYPTTKLEVVCINDGSSDDTWQQMLDAAGRHPAGAVRCIDLGSNQGKRAAMAAGIRATTAEIIVFVDSDSLPAPVAIRRLVQGFAEKRVGAVSGLTYVRNADANLLTAMQAARYYVSFQLLKTAESVLGAVACCSGCFAAYRRTAVLPLLEAWEHQRFLGVECTYGDDRALTNRILRSGWTTRYHAGAEAWTDAPEEYRKFFRQQLRWKKSWSREGPLLLTHLWRTRPLAFPGALVATLAGLLSPLVVFWGVVWKPVTAGTMPLVYVLGLFLVAMAYSLLYRALRRDGLWIYALIGTFFYVAFSAQLVWAILRVRDGSWGTRSV